LILPLGRGKCAPHTLASQLIDAGVGLPAVSARLGHSSIRTTIEIYSQMISGADDEVTRKFDVEITRPTRTAAAVTMDISPAHPNSAGGHEFIVTPE